MHWWPVFVSAHFERITDCWSFLRVTGPVCDFHIIIQHYAQITQSVTHGIVLKITGPFLMVEFHSSFFTVLPTDIWSTPWFEVLLAESKRHHCSLLSLHCPQRLLWSSCLISIFYSHGEDVVQIFLRSSWSDFSKPKGFVIESEPQATNFKTCGRTRSGDFGGIEGRMVLDWSERSGGHFLDSNPSQGLDHADSSICVWNWLSFGKLNCSAPSVCAIRLSITCLYK